MSATLRHRDAHPTAAVGEWVRRGFGWSVRGLRCEVQLQRRPSYCDRGDFAMHVLVDPGAELEVNVDAHDGLPRYVFFEDAAKLQAMEWLRRRRQLPEATP